MNHGDSPYIWQAADWPIWRYDLAALARPLADVSRGLGLMTGRMADVGMGPCDQASLTALTEDVIKTSEIEGERLDARSVRSSLARRLGIDIGVQVAADRHVEGVVEMVLDATANRDAPRRSRRLVCSGGRPDSSRPDIRGASASKRAAGARMLQVLCRWFPAR